MFHQHFWVLSLKFSTFVKKSDDKNLRLIKKLLGEGILTQEEFDREKQKILQDKSDINVKKSDDLRLIKRLQDDGILTQDQFDREKQKILGN